MKISDLVKISRSSEWLDYKLTIIFGTIYATAILQQVSLADLLPFFFFLLAALIPGAAYVSILNDLTDLEEDRLAGKENRLAGKSKSLLFILLFSCVAAGVIVGCTLSLTSLLLYLAAWISFTLYSLPPIRLKKRGIWGVLADASGAHVFPLLFAISVLSDWFHKEIDFIWFGAAALWSFSLGLRGILSHQLKDRDNDLLAGINTFATRRGKPLIEKLAGRLIFPIEIAAFLFMLGYTGSRLAFFSLAAYAFLEILRYILRGGGITLVGADKYDRILLNEYYTVFYPLSFLIAGLGVFSLAWAILVMHLLVFSQRLLEVATEIFLLLKSLVKTGLYVLRKKVVGNR